MKFISIILILFSYFLWAYQHQPASPTELNALITVADSSDVAKSRMKQFLTSHPTPSNAELYEIEGEINKIILFEVAKRTTGNANLKSTDELEKEGLLAQETEAKRLSNLPFNAMNEEEKMKHLAFEINRMPPLLLPGILALALLFFIPAFLNRWRNGL
ncbi:hypothetical protein [Methyloglobulus sp.]|jgi:hypothetical protein|uniref:hypothetical protein n=1 Tax=Methyloglobulus sp. TaxID=2518622 RepID=UPI0032B72E75